MFTYTYLLDVNHTPYLEKEIKASLSNLTNITNDKVSRNLDISFSTELTPEQKSTLDLVIDNYPNHNIPHLHSYTSVLTKDVKVEENYWYTVVKWRCSSIFGAYITSRMIPLYGDSLYDLRLVELSTNTVLVEKLAISNTDDSISSVSFASLVGNLTVELQCKKNNSCNYVVIGHVEYK